MTDSLTIFGTEYTGVKGFKAEDGNSNTLTYIRPQGTKSISANGSGIDVTEYAAVNVAVPSSEQNFVIHISENASTHLWEPDCTWADVLAAYNAGKNIVLYAGNGIDYYVGIAFGLDITLNSLSSITYEVDVVLTDPEQDEDFLVDQKFFIFSANGVVPSEAYIYYDTTLADAVAADLADGKIAYGANGRIVGTAGAKTSSDLVVSGATVTAPAGHYASDASASVASGTEGTPTATKGTVSSNSITVTPSVTNTAGYISGGTHSGTGVTVSASELVSGTKAITDSGTTDVTNYASASVAAGSATTPATTVTANPTISVNSSTGLITATASATKSVTPTVSAGYVSSGTAGTITVSGSNTSQLSTQAGATITPTKSQQTAVASGKYTTGNVLVAAIPAAYQDVTAVTAAAGDVVSGKDIVNSSGTVVHGSLVIQHYYTGSSAPSSATGANGDVYLQT